MKNFKPSMSFVASVILAALVVAPVFAAGPTQAPPTNLVNANFNSVMANSANFGNLLIDTNGDIDVTQSNGLSIYGTGTVQITKNGDIYAANGNIFTGQGNMNSAGDLSAGGKLVVGTTSQLGKLAIDQNGAISNPTTDVTVNDNLAATKIKAESIGKFITQTGTSTTLANTSPYTLYVSCPGTSKPISCSFYGNSTVSMLWSYADPTLNRCGVKLVSSVANVSAGPSAVCWDTNSF